MKNKAKAPTIVRLIFYTAGHILFVSAMFRDTNVLVAIGLACTSVATLITCITNRSNNH